MQQRQENQVQASSSLGAGGLVCDVSERRKSHIDSHFLQRDLGEQGPKAVADTLASVAATYEGLSEEEINALREPTAPGKWSAPARTAAKFLRECRLAKWVEARSREQSIAPVVSLVAQEARATNCLPPEPTSTKHKCQLQWLRRWRRRWNIILGSIAARGDIPLAEARQKASYFQGLSARGLQMIVFWFTFCSTNGPQMGSTIWPLFWVRRLFLRQDPGPFSGTHFWVLGTNFLNFRQRLSGTGRIFCMLPFRHMRQP